MPTVRIPIREFFIARMCCDEAQNSMGGAYVEFILAKDEKIN